MLNAAIVRGVGNLDDACAIRIADRWNIAYPIMRALVTERIEAERESLRRKIWNVDPTHPHADLLRATAPTEDTVRSRLKRYEELRRVLGQLDRGTHRACTRSSGGFSVSSAYAAVRGALQASSLNGDLSAVYELAAALSQVCEEQRLAWAAERSQKVDS